MKYQNVVLIFNLFLFFFVKFVKVLVIIVIFVVYGGGKSMCVCFFGCLYKIGIIYLVVFFIFVLVEYITSEYLSENF